MIGNLPGRSIKHNCLFCSRFTGYCLWRYSDGLVSFKLRNQRLSSLFDMPRRVSSLSEELLGTNFWRLRRFLKLNADSQNSIHSFWHRQYLRASKGNILWSLSFFLKFQSMFLYVHEGILWLNMRIRHALDNQSFYFSTYWIVRWCHRSTTRT